MFLEGKGHSHTVHVDRSRLAVLSALAQDALTGRLQQPLLPSANDSSGSSPAAGGDGDGDTGNLLRLQTSADKFGASIFGFETTSTNICGWRPRGLFEIMKFKPDPLGLSGGSAFLSGLRVGDIIYAVGGQPVTSVRQIDALTRPLASLATPGASRVSVAVWRPRADDHDLLHERFVEQVEDLISTEVAAAAATQWHNLHEHEVTAAQRIQVCVCVHSQRVGSVAVRRSNDDCRRKRHRFD